MQGLSGLTLHGSSQNNPRLNFDRTCYVLWSLPNHVPVSRILLLGLCWSVAWCNDLCHSSLFELCHILSCLYIT